LKLLSPFPPLPPPVILAAAVAQDSEWVSCWHCSRLQAFEGGKSGPRAGRNGHHYLGKKITNTSLRKKANRTYRLEKLDSFVYQVKAEHKIT
jgi:hypothetical protein